MHPTTISHLASSSRRLQRKFVLVGSCYYREAMSFVNDGQWRNGGCDYIYDIQSLMSEDKVVVLREARGVVWLREMDTNELNGVGPMMTRIVVHANA